MFSSFKELKKYLIAVFAISLFIALFIVTFFFITIENALIFDFISFLTGASIINAGEGSRLYDITLQTFHQQNILDPFGLKIGENLNLLPFLNLPLMAVLFIPFLYVPYLISFKIYVFTLLFSLLLTTVLISKRFNNIKLYSFWSLMPFLYYPSIGSVFIGQTSVLLTFLVFNIFWNLKAGKYLIAGLLGGLLLMKIQYVILIPFVLLIIGKRMEFLKGFLISAFFVIMISALFADNFWGSYITLLAGAQTPVFGLLDSKLFTLYGSLKQIAPFSGMNFNLLFTLNLSAYVLSMGIFFLNNKLSFEKKFAVSVLLTMVFCIHGVDYDQSLLLIPIYILLNNFLGKNKSTVVEKTALLSLILLPILIILSKGMYTSFILILISIFLTISTNSKPERILPSVSLH